MEKWKPTPEGYADLLVSMVRLMEQDKAWQQMLSRLYACANQLYCTNGCQCPHFNDSERLKAHMQHLRKQARAELEEALTSREMLHRLIDTLSADSLPDVEWIIKQYASRDLNRRYKREERAQ